MDETETKRGKSPASLANLKPIKPGQVLNKEGKNGLSEAHALLVKYMLSKDPLDTEERTRLDVIMGATFETARVVGKEGSADRKLLIEQVAGRARQQIDLSNEDKSLAGVSAAVGFVDAVLNAALSKGKKDDADPGG
ncbi:MAG: hypothetical protein ABFE07_23560 [Armatimonadia bacterium]